MKTSLLSASLLLLCLATQTAAAQDPALHQDYLDNPSVDLPPELDRILRDYEREWAASNPEALAALFTEDGFALPSSRAPFRGHAAITEAYQIAGGALSLRALAFATEGSVGYIIGTYSYDPADGDRGKFVLAIKRNEAGRWLIAADIDNSIRR